MNTLTLPWFPPAPAPLSILELPPDDWALEPKIDGIRVIWLEGRVYTRHGALLSLTKGAERLSRMLSGMGPTLDGEWVPGTDTYVVFDLPDCPLEYDGRRQELVSTLRVRQKTSRLDFVRSERSPRIETCPNSPKCAGLAWLSFATDITGDRLVPRYATHNFRHVLEGLKRTGAEGVVLKRRRSGCVKQLRSDMENREWLKRRFVWDAGNFRSQNFHSPAGG